LIILSFLVFPIHCDLRVNDREAALLKGGFPEHGNYSLYLS
jgi:hypothetical protein